MPTYQYVCTTCQQPLEAVQSFTDDALTECPACETGKLRKVFNSVGVVFKGPGFYRTDSRTATGSESLKPAGDTSTAASTSDAPGKKSTEPTPSTPAKTAQTPSPAPAPSGKTSTSE